MEECFISESCNIHDTQTFLQYCFLLPHNSVILAVPSSDNSWLSWIFMRTMRSYYDRYSMQCWLSPQFVVLNASNFFMDFLFLLWYNFCHAKRYTMITSLHMFITDTSCFFELCNSLIDGVSWLCNTQQKTLSTATKGPPE